MSNDIGFDPYLDYSKITDEMIQDLHVAAVEIRESHSEMIERPTRDAAERLLRAADNIAHTEGAIKNALITVPSMVHIVDEPQEEHEDPDDPTSAEMRVQRCSRCKSILMLWRPGLVWMTDEGPREVDPDDVEWHKPGIRLAKSSLAHAVTMYEIGDRDLEKHERECVGF